MSEESAQESPQNPPEPPNEPKSNTVSQFQYTGQQRVIKSPVKGVGLIVQQECAYVLQEPEREPVVIFEWEKIEV